MLSDLEIRGLQSYTISAFSTAFFANFDSIILCVYQAFPACLSTALRHVVLLSGTTVRETGEIMYISAF